MGQLSDEMIISPSNATIKLIRALRHRKERTEQGRFFVEGIRIVAEAVQTEAAIDYLVLAPELLTSSFADDLIKSQRQAGTPCLSVSAKVFESLSSKQGPQGLAAVVRQSWQMIEGIRPGAGDLWVALDAPQDPGNLGTIMRTADAVGARGVILIGHSADPYDPAAVRASMGSVFSMQLVQTDIDLFLAWKARAGASLCGTSGAAKFHYRQVRYPRPLVLLSGSERQGLPEQLLAACDQLVSIPMVGRCDSLNLAVATSIVLYEAHEQRQD